MVLKKAFLLSALSGILLVAAWPTQGFPWFIFGAFVPLFFIEKNIAEQRHNYPYAYLFGWSYFAFALWNIGTTWWLVNASVFGMIFANACNSLFFTLLFLGFHWAKKRMPLRSAYLFFICLWLAFESFHMQWDFSWPWLSLGHVFSESIQWIQWYEYTGVFGGSLWVLLVNILLFEASKHGIPSTSFPQWLRKTIPLFAVVLGPISCSLVLFQKEWHSDSTVRVAMTQPNIDPYAEKYQYSNADYLQLLNALMKTTENNDFDYILTPETYFAAGYGERLEGLDNSPFYESLRNFTAQYPKAQLITGVQLFDTYNSIVAPTTTANKVRDRLWVDYYNSALAIAPASEPQIYHKSKLVVGVENMPYKNFFEPILGSFLLDMGGTVSSRAVQEARSVFTHPITEVVAAPIICYESVYGAFVTEYVRKGAQFLAVITNDAWWGNTPGHRQLLSITRLRAIETRRAIARSANTGVSAVISPKGEVLDHLAYQQKGVLTANIPLYERLTFYTQYGDYLTRWASFVALLYFVLGLSGRLKHRR